MPTNNELPRSVLWSQFFERVASALNAGAVVLWPKRIVAWMCVPPQPTHHGLRMDRYRVGRILAMV